MAKRKADISFLFVLKLSEGESKHQKTEEDEERKSEHVQFQIRNKGIGTSDYIVRSLQQMKQQGRIYLYSRLLFIIFSQLMQARIEVANIVERIAQFENQLTAEVKNCKLQLYCLGPSNLVNLTLTLKISNLERQMLTNAQLFYMNPTTRVCQYLGVYPFNQDIFVDIDPKCKDKIQFKFRKMGGPVAPNEQPNQNKNPRKCRQRTIGEVRLHLQNRNQIYRNVGQPFTLQQAADMVGLPKKTLDDYDRHIRIAQAYGFDLQRHKNSGMGVLRSFVKEHSSKEKADVGVKEQFMQPGYFLSIEPSGQP